MPAPKSKPSAPAKSTHGPKPKTGTPLPVPEQLKRLFKTLCAQIDGGHHSNAIKTCDKILRISASDPDALQTKLFLLLTTDQPAAAITLIESLSGEGAGALRYSFERAYALYCLHKKDEARAALAQDAEGLVRLLSHHSSFVRVGLIIMDTLQNYREGAYAEAFEIYNELLDSAPTAEEQADILTNTEAASAHLEFIDTTFLHALDALPTAVQSQLEDAPPPTAAPHAPLAAVAAAPAPAKETLEKKKTVRLPKGVVLGVTPPPDPERWLKKSERTNFGQRRRKGGAGGGGGGATQGSAADVPAAVESGKGGSGNAKGKGKKKK
ncbi:hypothetical protein B0H14DRAFT_3084977 [Mycena olivaceomarginata]|nr:hypothetical protein B0H14DRAFT_3084977 [Mycena olivaceomarginata]